MRYREILSHLNLVSKPVFFSFEAVFKVSWISRKSVFFSSEDDYCGQKVAALVRVTYIFHAETHLEVNFDVIGFILMYLGLRLMNAGFSLIYPGFLLI